MSLLLKALEKSEDEKKEGEAVAEQAAPAGASSGFKLSGGSGQSGSKLGSAMASRQVKKTKDAERVVAAYDQVAEDDTDHLVAASRKQNLKRLAFVLVVAVAGGAGYFAYQEFAPGFLGDDQVASTESQSSETAPPAIQVADQASLLPLPEPIYDIQESILIASLDPNANVSAADGAEENIAKQVTDVVASIIQEQEDEQRKDFLLTQVDISQQESLEEEIEGLLSQSFDPDSARDISTLDQISMLDDLNALSERVYDSKNFTIQPSNYVAKLDVVGADAFEESVATQVEPIQLIVNDDKTADLIEQGSLNYRYGSLLEAEKAFRTVIASEPTNVNALLGLAKIHQSRGNRKLALATLLKASEYAPNDPNITGELIALQAEGASTKVIEQRVLKMLNKADSPTVRAKLLFSLGNAYAREQSWLEARNAYRGATELNKSNPDYLFNLAVMSDHLRDKEGALGYYQRALDHSRSNPSSFDHAAARKRIDELKSIL